jgi:hypothetical protein
LPIPVPQPNHNICNVCHQTINNYDNHILSREHIWNARFQRDILDIIDEQILNMGGKAGNKDIKGYQ